MFANPLVEQLLLKRCEGAAACFNLLGELFKRPLHIALRQGVRTRQRTAAPCRAGSSLFLGIRRLDARQTSQPLAEGIELHQLALHLTQTNCHGG